MFVENLVAVTLVLLAVLTSYTLGQRHIAAVINGSMHCTLLASCFIVGVLLLLLMLCLVLYQELCQQTLKRSLSMAIVRQILWACLPLVMVIALAYPAILAMRQHCC